MDIDQEKKLADHIASFAWDPLGFVYYAYPWGEKDTILEKEDGPDDWQIEVLEDLKNECLAAQRIIQAGGEAPSVRISVKSGHGIGKTALVSWVTHWFMSTKPNPQLVVTANTKTQLDTKTWRELAKWHKLSIHEHWFTWTGQRFYQKQNPSTWCANAVSWSIDNPDAFAGTHEKWTMMIFDEASAIADVIWEVAEGAMTDPGAIWLAFGNPTRNTGKFSECFKAGSRWIKKIIDSRSAKRTNKLEIEKWIEEYGEDSDFIRVRVKGQEPRQEIGQMIPQSLVDEAYGKELTPVIYQHEPKIMGFDVGAGGQDPCVIRKRQGLNANFNPMKFPGDPEDLTIPCEVLARAIDEWKPDAVFVDAVGVGMGVPGIMKRMGYSVTGINGKNRAIEQQKYSNRRTEMLYNLKRWLADGGAIDKSKELKADLVAPQVGSDSKGRLQVENKKDTKKRLKRSCDDSDALALTFAETVAVKNEDDFEDWLAMKGRHNHIGSPDLWMAA